MHKESEKKWKFRQSFAHFLQKVLRKSSRTGQYNGPKDSFLILAQEKIGDAILLTPLLKNLRACFPESSIDILTFSKAVFGFFQSDPNTNTVYYAKDNPPRYIGSILSRKFDILFNTKDHPSTNFLVQSLLVQAHNKVGILNEFHIGIYDYLVPIEYHAPIALKNCGLLKILGEELKPEKCRPYIPPMSVSKPVREFLEKLETQTCTGINISAGNQDRYWTEKNWRKLVRAFHNKSHIILCSPEDIEKKKRLEQTCDNIIPSPRTRNIYEAGLITRKLRLLVTPDTAMVHAASCFNTPVVGLYGKALQDQSRFSPFLIDHKMVVSPTAFVKNISAEIVIDALREISER